MAYNIRKRSALSIRSITSLFIIVILLFAIKNSFSSLSGLSSGKERLTDLQRTLQKEKKENAYLKERLSYVQSDQFVEEEAREKLGLVKEGEYIVIAPPPTDKVKEDETIDTRPNWKKWWELFF